MAHETQEPDVIRQQMQDTRAALADKLESLEQHVIGTVQDTTAAVADTAEKVSEAVGDTVETVRDTVESVKETFDLRLQFERHPWALLGGSVAAGFVMGRLMQNSAAAAENGNGHAAAPPPRLASNGHHAPPASKPAYLSQLLAPEMEMVKALALGALIGAVRDLVGQSLPSSLQEPVRDVMDRITDKLGGQPVRGPVLEPARLQPVGRSP